MAFNRMCLSHVNSACMILYIFLIFNCAVFPNMNLVKNNFCHRVDTNFEQWYMVTFL